MATRETVLVTGGASFIGSHTCKALAAQSLLPIAFDNLARGHADLVRWGPLARGDILDQSVTRYGVRALQARLCDPFRGGPSRKQNN